jgi:hypothetical protein
MLLLHRIKIPNNWGQPSKEQQRWQSNADFVVKKNKCSIHLKKGNKYTLALIITFLLQVGSQKKTF